MNRSLKTSSASYARASLTAALLLLLTSCIAPAPAPRFTIAAASNLSVVFGRIGAEFEQQTKVRPVFSFGSTAQLTRQIEEGGPFDVFAAADTDHVDQLNRKGLLAPDSRIVYARGILALWIPTGKANAIGDLAGPGIRFIALAKPELAPYGAAAVEALHNAGAWEQVKGKVVFAENITAAKQYGVSGNADAVFTAYSLVLKETGRILRIEPHLHKPIDQAAGAIARSPNLDSARKFLKFLHSPRGREILTESGYEIP